VFSDRSRDEIAELELAVAQRPQAREAQRALARDVTTLVHGAEATERVEAAAAALFGRGELTDLDPTTLDDALAQLPGAAVPRGSHAVADLLQSTGLVASKSAGRRAIAEGGAYVNNARVEAEDAEVGAEDLLHGRWLVIRRGRRSLAAIDMTD